MDSCLGRRRPLALLLLLLAAGLALRAYMTMQDAATQQWLAYYRGEAQTVLQQLRYCQQQVQRAQNEYNEVVGLRKMLVKQKNAAALHIHKSVEKCRADVRFMREKELPLLQFNITKAQAQLQGGAAALPFAIYDVLAKLDGQLPQNIWMKHYDDERLRNTLIVVMANKLAFSVQQLQALDTPVLVELAQGSMDETGSHEDSIKRQPQR